MTRTGGIKMLCLLKRTQQMVRELLQLIIFPFFASDTTYERLLSVFVGSYYVDVRTLNDMTPNVVSKDVVTTRDALGKPFQIDFTHCLPVYLFIRDIFSKRSWWWTQGDRVYWPSWEAPRLCSKHHLLEWPADGVNHKHWQHETHSSDGGLRNRWTST